MLQLFRNGEPADFSPIYAGASFYFTAGQIGHSAAFDGWTHEQTLFEDMGPPEIGEDGEPIEQTPVVKEVVSWSLVAVPVPPEPEPDPLTPEQIRAAMPTLSPVQFRKMLRGQDITAAMVEAAIAGIADDDLRADAADAWEYATFFERLNPLIELIGAALGLTPEQIDTAWLGAVDA